MLQKKISLQTFIKQNKKEKNVLHENNLWLDSTCINCNHFYFIFYVYIIIYFIIIICLSKLDY